MKRGYFFSLEGGEGAGKSTMREYIAEKLRAMGHTVVLTREPGGTPLAERIRELLLSPSDETMCIDTELLLMFAARAQHVQKVIKPHMEKGSIVISDRFIDSTYAYQHYARKVPLERIQEIEKFTLQGFQPDLCFMFDLPVEVGMSRAAARGKLDRFEQEGSQFFEDVRSGYLARFCENRYQYAFINAAASIEEVKQQIDFYISQMVFE